MLGGLGPGERARPRECAGGGPVESPNGGTGAAVRRVLAAATSVLTIAAMVGVPARPAPAAPRAITAAVATATTARPIARVSAAAALLTSGKVRVRVTSNARRVQIRYRTASGARRALTRRLTSRTARVTLPAGAHAIRARAQGTSRLRASAWVPVPVSATVVPPTLEPPPTFDLPATPSPPVPLTPTVNHPSGPAGFSTTVSGLNCPPAPAGQKAVWATTWPDGLIVSYYWSSEGRPVGGFTTPRNQPVGPARIVLDCRYIPSDQLLYAAKTAQVVVAYPFDVTVTAPEPTLVPDVARAQPGQVINVTQVGNCGNQPIARANWSLSASDGSINPTILGEPTVGANGEWGPVSVTLPTTPMPAGSWYLITATCTTADEQSGVGYAPLQIPVG